MGGSADGAVPDNVGVYSPGDVVNGFVLTEERVWAPYDISRNISPSEKQVFWLVVLFVLTIFVVPFVLSFLA